MHRSHLSLSFLGLAGIATLVAGCGSSTGARAPASYGPQQTVVVAEPISDAITLDPNVAYELHANQADRLMYDNLVRFAPGKLNKVVPSLATSWSLSGNTWTFHLRHGVKFSDGDSVTAQDVTYSFDRAVSIANNPASWLLTQMGITAQNVTSLVQAAGKYTVTIHLPSPFSPGAFVAIMTNSVTSIVNAKVVQQHVKNGDWGTAWLSDHSAGSGPYTLQNWTPDVKISMVANSNYNLAPEPSVKRIIMSNANDSTTELDMLQRGTADIATDLTGTQLASLNRSQNGIFKTPDIAIAWLGMDPKNVPQFNNPDVREAVKYALDYKGIVQDLLHGNGVELQTLVPRGLFGSSSSLPFQQNIAKARSLMAASGQKPFSVTLLMSSSPLAGGVSTTSLGTVIKSDLAQIGITVNLEQIARSEMISQFRAKKAQMILNNWYMDYPDAQDFIGPFADYNQQAVVYQLQYNNPQINSLVEQAGTLQDTPQRAAILQRIDQLEQAGPIAVLYQPDVAIAYSKKLHGVSYDPANFLDFTQMTKK